jgi:hypothetical protein
MYLMIFEVLLAVKIFDRYLMVSETSNRDRYQRSAENSCLHLPGRSDETEE